jgi:hypothetical protein
MFVEEAGTRRPVVGGSEREVLVWDERRKSAIALHNVALSAVVSPKLTSASVIVDALKGYPVYSPAKDPASAAHAQQAFLHNLEGARMEESEMNMRKAQAAADLANAQADMSNPQQAQMAAEAQATADQTIAESADALGDTVYRDSEVGAMHRREDFDGFAVSFALSTPQPLHEAFGVLRLRYRESARAGAPVGHAMKLFRLRKLEAKPRKVVVRQFGLPPGFVVDSYQIHLYAGGSELATNQSANRVNVTEDEAHQFLILRHTQLNPGATLPAQIAREILRDAPPAMVRGQLKGVVVDFNITADGKVAEVTSGIPLSGPSAAEIVEALRAVRFLPALVNGKPSASRGTFAIGELFFAPGT